MYKCSEGSKEYNYSLRTTSQIPRGCDNSDPTGGRPIQDESILRTRRRVENIASIITPFNQEEIRTRIDEILGTT